MWSGIPFLLFQDLHLRHSLIAGGLGGEGTAPCPGRGIAHAVYTAPVSSLKSKQHQEGPFRPESFLSTWEISGVSPVLPAGEAIRTKSRFLEPIDQRAGRAAHRKLVGSAVRSGLSWDPGPTVPCRHRVLSSPASKQNRAVSQPASQCGSLSCQWPPPEATISSASLVASTANSMHIGHWLDAVRTSPSSDARD